MDNGYIYTIFIVITLRWMKVFQSDFLVGGVDFRWWKFPQIFGRITQATAATLCLQKIFAWPNWMEKLLSCTLFVYLFTYLFIYLFIIYLLICLLFIYFKGAVYKVMHQICGWVPLGGAISIKLCSNFSEIALAHFALLRLCCWMW